MDGLLFGLSRRNLNNLRIRADKALQTSRLQPGRLGQKTPSIDEEPPRPSSNPERQGDESKMHEKDKTKWDIIKKTMSEVETDQSETCVRRSSTSSSRPSSARRISSKKSRNHKENLSGSSISPDTESPKGSNLKKKSLKVKTTPSSKKFKDSETGKTSEKKKAKVISNKMQIIIKPKIKIKKLKMENEEEKSNSIKTEK